MLLGQCLEYTILLKTFPPCECLIYFKIRKNKYNTNKYVIMKVVWITLSLSQLSHKIQFLILFYRGRGPGRQKCLRSMKIRLL
jgi:hypothetical protein